jgi:DNA-binding PucR family transcriptional regulator
MLGSWEVATNAEATWAAVVCVAEASARKAVAAWENIMAFIREAKARAALAVREA